MFLNVNCRTENRLWRSRRGSKGGSGRAPEFLLVRDGGGPSVGSGGVAGGGDSV